MSVIYWNTSDGENLVHEVRDIESRDEARGVVQTIEARGPYRAVIRD